MTKTKRNTKLKTQNNTDRTPYHYCIHIAGPGGKAVIGRVSGAVAKYWNGFDPDQLVERHILNDSRFDRDLNDNQIDPDFTTRSWFDCNDAINENGPVVECEPDLIVEANGNRVFKGSVGRGALKRVAGIPVAPEIDQSSSWMMAHTADFVEMVFCIDVIGKFNPRKLKLRSTQWFGDASVISGLSYDGVEANLSNVRSMPIHNGQATMGIVMNDNDLIG